MPYIKPIARGEMERGFSPMNAGELNYSITKMIDDYIASREGGLAYGAINEVIGVLECAKLELYRRVAAPYEDKKIAENGDVYTDTLITYTRK